MKKIFAAILVLVLAFCQIPVTAAPASVSDLTPVDLVVVGVVVPNAGDTTESAPGAFALGSGYHITTANWCDEEGNELGSTVTFASGETYYIKASASSEEGYFFRQGEDGTSFEVDGGELKSTSITNWTDSDGGPHSYAEIIIAVRAAAVTSFFGVLISDAEGTMNKGGSYWMDYAGMEGSPSRTSSSNNFVEDGSDVYLEAYPADGYKFLGWYQGDPDMADGKLYTGEPLTTDSVYEFDAPISLARPYICAVFGVDDSPQGDQVQMWVGNTEVIGPDSSAQGGRVAVQYTPSYDIYPEITAKDGTNFVAGEILQFYKGDECTVYQQADEGFHFVGWYHVNIEWGPGETLAWEGSPISTADSFTYKPGQTVVAGDSEPLRYVCAVFEKDQAVTHTVSFDPGTGYGEMESYTVNDGASFEPPLCTFKHSNPDRVFYKWAVDGKFLRLGESFTVTKDTVVKAVWHYREIQRLDNSVDRSVTEVVGQLILKDTRTGEELTENVFDEATASAFTEPSNPTVNAMITEAKQAAAQKAQEYAGESAVTTVSETVSDPAIKDLKDDRTYTYFTDGQDSAGDVYTLLIIDGGYLHSWQYDVTLVAEYTSVDPSTATITLHWSSIDGVDLMDPVVIEFTPGMTYSQVLETKGWTMDTALFEKEGYRWIFRHELKPITDFANEEDPRTAMWDERLKGDEVLEDGTDVYCMMYKEVDSAEVTIVPPACGTETTTPQDGSWWKWDEQTNRPVFSTPGAAGYHADAAANGSSWESNEDGDAPFIGTFKGGQEYFAELWLEADFGYAFKEDPHDTYGGALAVNGATLIRSFWDYDYLGVSVRVPVEHDWSDWKTNKEPSETEDGEESRTCALCGETETRPIPHQAVEYRSTDGDGKSWEKGSTNPLTFTFKRNRSDETALSHFTGIRMDGADVDPSKYTKVSGSVIITLPPAYLETLSAGKHTLDALFNDGNTVTVYFNVTDKTVPTATPVPSKPVTPNTGDNSNPGLWAALLAISVLGLAFMLKRKKA